MLSFPTAWLAFGGGDLPSLNQHLQLAQGKSEPTFLNQLFQWARQGCRRAGTELADYHHTAAARSKLQLNVTKRFGCCSAGKRVSNPVRWLSFNAAMDLVRGLAEGREP